MPSECIDVKELLEKKEPYISAILNKKLGDVVCIQDKVKKVYLNINMVLDVTVYDNAIIFTNIVETVAVSSKYDGVIFIYPNVLCESRH